MIARTFRSRLLSKAGVDFLIVFHSRDTKCAANVRGWTFSDIERKGIAHDLVIRNKKEFSLSGISTRLHYLGEYGQLSRMSYLGGWAVLSYPAFAGTAHSATVNMFPYSSRQVGTGEAIGRLWLRNDGRSIWSTVPATYSGLSSRCH